MGSVEVPKKHKACVYDNPGSISTKVEEIDTAEPGYGEVLVNLYALNLFRLEMSLSRQVSIGWELCLVLHESELGPPANFPLRTHSGVCHSDLGVMTNSVWFSRAPNGRQEVDPFQPRKWGNLRHSLQLV